MLVAIHAIVAAGGNYVPLDTDSPVDRTRYMLDIAGARCVLIAAGTAPEALDGLGDGIDVPGSRRVGRCGPVGAAGHRRRTAVADPAWHGPPIRCSRPGRRAAPRA